ncbi:hypothetical protein Ahia01_001136800 [Argonauta hians]
MREQLNAHIKYHTNPDPIYIHSHKEYWWNLTKQTMICCRHNRSDIVTWDSEKETCINIKVTCPANTNVHLKTQEKENIYGELIQNLQLIYPKYKFNFVPIIIGALGYVNSDLQDHLEKLGFNTTEKKKLTYILQIQSIKGTVKITKTFQGLQI